jgi:hypothetical protein
MLEVIALAEAGKIRSDVDIYPFEEVEHANGRLESGQSTGRAAIQLNPKSTKNGSTDVDKHEPAEALLIRWSITPRASPTKATAV